jgi:integrase
MNPLALHLDNYLKLRRQLGYKLRNSGYLLHRFVRFAQQERATFITTKLALGWATYPPHIPPVQKTRRLGLVRGFAQYVSVRDMRTEVPAAKLLPSRTARRAPYLYQAKDILRLIEATRQIDTNCPLKGATYATLMGLLATTGMRVGEAIGLDRNDVDLTCGLITVRHAKGDKPRLVPLHRISRQVLRRYAVLRDEVFPHPFCSRFFVTERGTCLHYDSVNRWFRFITHQIGLCHVGDRPRPQLHALRHYFAIQTMLRWYRSKTDVEARLPELCTYLGHAQIRDTYWYLSAVPELLRLATRRCQRKEAGQ